MEERNEQTPTIYNSLEGLEKYIHVRVHTPSFSSLEKYIHTHSIYIVYTPFPLLSAISGSSFRKDLLM